jgi:Flp pilus assembly protein TadG
VLVYCIISVTALTAICSLAVDFGRVQVAKTELRRAADAAALYASTGLSNGTQFSRAQAVVTQNPVDGGTITLSAGDVVAGTWANGTFTAGGFSPNAVQITLRRSIPLMFGGAIGMNNCQVTASAICAAATSTQSSGYGFVGIDSIDVRGNGLIDSYRSAAGAYSAASRRANADVATNGHARLDGNAKVYGDVFHRTGYTVNGNAGLSSGQWQVLSNQISYAPPTLPNSYTNMGNFNGNGNGSLTLTSGNYYFTSFTANGNFTINVTGEVNVYVDGDFTLNGNMSSSGNLPASFRVHMLSSAGATLNGNSDVYADVYAPMSPVKISGNGDFFGRAIGKTLSISGNGNLHYDESLPAIRAATMTSVLVR